MLTPNPTEVQDKYLGLPLINGRVTQNSSNILSLDENCSLSKKIPSAENNFGNFMQSIMLSNPPPPPNNKTHPQYPGPSWNPLMYIRSAVLGSIGF